MNYSCLCREKLSLLDNVHTIERLKHVGHDYSLLLVEISDATMIKDIPWRSAPRMAMLAPRGCLRSSLQQVSIRIGHGNARHLTENLVVLLRQHPFYIGEEVEENRFRRGTGSVLFGQ
jgi:hypothetical protein